MMQRILNSKNFVAWPLTAPTGMVVYLELPFAGDNVFLSGMALRISLVQQGLFYSYNLFWFTTPYIAYSTLLSGPHVFGFTVDQRIRTGKFTPYSDPSKRNDLFLVVGEIHDKRQPEPSETPHSLTLPEGVLFTTTAIVGAIGSGKTSRCMYPFAEGIFLYRASDHEMTIGGLVLAVKKDFCHKVRKILDRHGRAEDYIETPNDLDAYALAYNISLLNNLFGMGSAPWLVAKIQKKSSAGLRTTVRGKTRKLCTMKRPMPFTKSGRVEWPA